MKKSFFNRQNIIYTVAGIAVLCVFAGGIFFGSLGREKSSATPELLVQTAAAEPAAEEAAEPAELQTAAIDAQEGKVVIRANSRLSDSLMQRVINDMDQDNGQQYMTVAVAAATNESSRSSFAPKSLVNNAELSADLSVAEAVEEENLEDADVLLALMSEDIEYLSLYNKGVSDKSVAYIQQRLMELGFMEYAEPTEYYGSITMEAVKLFQRQNDLKQDGVIGEETIGMIMSPDAKSYMLKKGMEGSDVTNIQNRLYELGYLDSKSLINGCYDESTEKAVQAMQIANDLAGDGLIGEMTIELMYSADVKANLVSFGDKNDIVLTCQKRLKELGYLTTTPDGSYGNDTLAAVKLFQSKNDLVVDGFLGPTTRDALESGMAVANGLTLGDEGDTVKRVQELLIKYGYMNSGANTGYFGEVTEKAVKNFQASNGLRADGNVGMKTMNILTGNDVIKAGERRTTDTGDSGRKSNDSGSDDSYVADDYEYTGSGSVKELIKVAKSKLGCKYVWGSKGPNTFDCSGFVYWCLQQVGVKQSYITSYGWRTVGKYQKISSISKVKAGDIVVVYGHVGIAAGDGMVIDASSSSGKIVYRELGSWWKQTFICAWRIFD